MGQPRFELESDASKAPMLDHCTTVPVNDHIWNLHYNPNLIIIFGILISFLCFESLRRDSNPHKTALQAAA